MSDRTKGNFILLFTAIIWGSGFIAQKLGMAFIGPFAFNSSRQLIGGLVLIPYAIYEAKKTGYLSRDKFPAAVVDRHVHQLIKGGLICGFMLCCATNLQQIGLQTVSAGKSGFITAIYIVLVPIVGLFFGERNSLRIWGSVILAMIGFGFLSLKGGDTGISSGDIITLASSLFFAFQIVAVNAHVTKSNAILLSTVQMLFSACLGCTVAFIVEHPTWVALAASAKPILYAALVPTAIGYTGQVVGQKYTDPTVASLLMSLEAVFAVILGVMFLNEHIMLREALGCVIIFSAVIIAQLPDKNPEDPQE